MLLGREPHPLLITGLITKARHVDVVRYTKDTQTFEAFITQAYIHKVKSKMPAIYILIIVKQP